MQGLGDGKESRRRRLELRESTVPPGPRGGRCKAWGGGWWCGLGFDVNERKRENRGEVGTIWLKSCWYQLFLASTA